MGHSINKKKPTLLFFFLIIIITLFLGIGYAQISNVTLNVSGVASADAQTGIVISSISYVSNNNANAAASTINTYYQTMMNSHIALGNTSSSSITYSVTITNLSDKAKKYVNTLYDSEFYDNDDIVFELNGIDNTTVVDPGDDITFTITFEYDANLSTITNQVLNSVLNFHFENNTQVIDDFDPSGVCEFHGENNDIIGSCANGQHIDHINTGIALFSSANHNNDFEIGFTIDSIDPSRFRSGKVDTIFDCIDDSSTYPGIAFRIENSKWFLQVGTGTNNKKLYWNRSDITSFVLKKVNNKVYYSINGGAEVFVEDLTNILTFDTPLVLGTALDDHGNVRSERFLIADLTNLYVKTYPQDSLEEPQSRTYATVDQEILDFVGENMMTAFESSGQHTFDGTSANIIDTNVELLSSINYQKSFIITFTIDELVASSNTAQATLFNVKDESKTNVWPGLMMRLNSSRNNYELAMKDGTTTASVTIPLTTNRINVIKKGMKMYYQVDLDEIKPLGNTNDFTNYPVANTFNIPVTFGCNINANGNYDRMIVGKLSDMKIQVPAP